MEDTNMEVESAYDVRFNDFHNEPELNLARTATPQTQPQTQTQNQMLNIRKIIIIIPFLIAN